MPRGYAKLVHSLWTGDLGLLMRADAQPTMQALAPYLIGCEHATMTGLYRLPIGWIAADLGWTVEGASKALRSLSEGGFARYDDAREIVWVVEAFRHEFPRDSGTPEKPDNAAKAMPAILEPVRKSFLINEFLDKYLATHPNLLTLCKPLRSPLVSPFEGAPPQGAGSSDQRSREEPPKPPAAAGGAAGGRKRAPKEPDAEIPTELLHAVPDFRELWARRLKSAAEKRRRPGPTGQASQLELLRSGLDTRGVSDVVEILEMAINRSWQGMDWRWFDEERAREKRAHGNGRSHQRDDRPNPYKPTRAQLDALPVDHPDRLFWDHEIH